MVRFWWYTPRCTMILSPGEACRIARWIDCPGHTCQVAADAVPETASNAAMASANVTAVRLISPPLGAFCRGQATPGSADCKGWSAITCDCVPGRAISRGAAWHVEVTTTQDGSPRKGSRGTDDVGHVLDDAPRLR